MADDFSNLKRLLSWLRDFRSRVESGENNYPIPGKQSAREEGVWLIWDSGPKGEQNYTDHRYWLRRAYLSNATGDAATVAPKLKEIDNTNQPEGLFWITASNLAERPANTGGTETNGSHTLAKGTPVFDVRPEIDTGDAVARWVFSCSQRPARVKIDSARTCGGAYKAYLWKPPTTLQLNFTTASSITEANYGTQGQEIHLINVAELTLTTHKMTAGTPVVKFCWAVPSLFTSSDGKPVYEALVYDVKAC